MEAGRRAVIWLTDMMEGRVPLMWANELPPIAPAPEPPKAERPAAPEAASTGGALDFFFEDGGQRKKVRVVQRDGAPWFIAVDVASLLGYAKPHNAIAAHCRGSLKQGVPTASGVQDMILIPEPDVYRLVTRSHLPAAQRLERWVFEDVLPSIRKNGGYIAGQEKVATGEMTREELMARAVLAAEGAIRDAEAARRLAEERAAELEGAVAEKARVIEEQATDVAAINCRSFGLIGRLV